MDNSITSLTVYCGSKMGNDPIYAEHAEELARLIAEKTSIRKIRYGGGFEGLMGIFTLAAARYGIEVEGIIIPAFQNDKKPPPDLAHMFKEVVVPTLAERKTVLQASDAALVMAGGLGTFDELFATVAEQDVKFHSAPEEVTQPAILLNTKGYYEDTVSQIRKALKEGFLDAARARFVAGSDTPEGVVTLLNKISEEGRWRMCDFRRPPQTPENNLFCAHPAAPVPLPMAG